jgi:hypothetical protein
VPNINSNSLTVVQASSGNVAATISADASNLLNAPISASFDGERILVTNNPSARRDMSRPETALA